MVSVAFVSSFAGDRVGRPPCSRCGHNDRRTGGVRGVWATAERLDTRRRINLPGGLALPGRTSSPGAFKAMRRLNIFQRTKHDSEIVKLAVPNYASMLMDPLASLADTVFVGRMGVLPLAGVGVANSLFSYFSWMFFFLVSTTTTEVATVLNIKDKEEREERLSRTVAGALWIALAIGTISLAVAWVGAPALVTLFGASADVSPFAIRYLRIRALALPFHMCFFVLSGVLRGMKDFRSPFVASVVCNVTNVALDAFVLWGLAMGVGGIAAATTIAEVLSTAVLGYAVVRKGCISLKHLPRLPCSQTQDSILRPGAVMVMQAVSESATLNMACSMATRLGAVEAAAMALSRQLWNVVGVCWWPLSVVAQSMAAGFYSAGKPKAVQQSGDRLMQMAFVAACVVAFLIMGGAHVVPGLFTADLAVQRATEMILPIFALTLPFDAVCDVVDCSLTGCKQYKHVARAMLTASAVSMTVLVFLICGVQIGIRGVWIGLCTMSLTRLAMVLRRYISMTSATS